MFFVNKIISVVLFNQTANQAENIRDKLFITKVTWSSIAHKGSLLGGVAGMCRIL